MTGDGKELRQSELDTEDYALSMLLEPIKFGEIVTVQKTEGGLSINVNELNL